MRILFLSHYYPPEVNAPASRTSEHCRAWAANGHTVSVITCVPNHPAGSVYAGYRNRFFQKEQIDGVTVYRVLTFLTPNAGFFRRSVNFILYFLMATLVAPFLSRTDVVISTSPQFFCGLAGYAVSRIKRAPWVLEIRDLWPESIAAVGALKQGRLLDVLSRLATFAYRKADHIVALTHAFATHIAGQGVDTRNITVIRNGVDLSLFDPDRPDNSFALQHQFGDRFVAAYVGTLGMAHGLETVLHAADLLRDRRDILFVMVGDGACHARLKKLRNKLGLDNVLIPGLQDRATMPAVWAATSVSLVLLRDRPEFEAVIPSKIFECMAMRVPVILGVRGECAQLLNDAGAGLAIAPEDHAGLAEAISTLAGDSDQCDELGRNGRRYVAEHFDRSRLAAQYLTLLERLHNRLDAGA